MGNKKQDEELGVQSDLEYQSSDSEKEWVRGCYTGFLKKRFVWDEVKEDMEGECGGRMSLSSMGGNLILIRSTSDKSMEELVKDFDEWVSFYFEWIRPWKAIDVSQNRLVWTRWYGLPLHIWSTNFLSVASAKLGLFVKMDSATEQKTKVDVARVQISMSCLAKVDSVWKVRIDGMVFTVRVVEEAQCTCGNVIFNGEDDDSESSVGGSEHLDDSDGPGRCNFGGRGN